MENLKNNNATTSNNLVPKNIAKNINVLNVKPSRLHLWENKTSKTNNNIIAIYNIAKANNLIEENKEEKKMPLIDKINYVFIVLAITYFLGRFIIGFAFNL